MAAEITINQPLGAGAGAAGEARNDLWEGQEVELVASSGAGTSWAWSLLGTPPGSSATLTDGTTSLAKITPDVGGTYRVQLIEDGVNYAVRVFRVRYDNSGVLKDRGWALPAIDEGSIDGRDEANYGTNTRGWDEPWQFIKNDLLNFLEGFDASHLIFRPGGTEGDNVYTTWADIMAVFATMEGPVRIILDDSITSPVVIPNGTHDLESRGILVAATPAGVDVTLGDGTAATNLQNPAGFEHVNLTTVNSGNLGRITSDGSGLVFYAVNSTFINGSTSLTEPAILADNGSKIYLRGTSLFTGSNRTYKVAAGDSGEIWLEDAAKIEANKLAYEGTVSVIVTSVSANCDSVQEDLGGTFNLNVPTAGAEGTTFVYQPSGTAEDAVYTDWSILAAAHAAVEGPKVIQFDNTYAECSIPAGTYDLQKDTILRGRWTGQVTKVLMEDGAVFQNPGVIEGNLSILSRSSSTIIDFSSWVDGTAALHLRSEAALSLETDTVAPSSSLIEVPAGGSLDIFLEGDSKLVTPSGVALHIVEMLGAGQVNVYVEGGLIGSSRLDPTAGDAFDPGGSGAVDVYLFSDWATILHSDVTGLTVRKFSERKVVVPLCRAAVSNPDAIPTACGASYVSQKNIPQHPNLTCKFRAMLETTNASAGYEAYADLLDIYGQLNAGTPDVVTGSEIDTGSGSPPAGAPTPNPIIASLYEVDLTAAIVGGTWVSDVALFEARVWIGTSGGGNAATCKSAELVFEW